MQNQKDHGCEMSGSSGTRRFLQSATGATVVEYAILLALLIGGATLGYYTLGSSTRDLFTGLTNMNGSIASAERPLTQYPRESFESDLAGSPVAGQAPSGWALLGGWYIALAFGVVTLYMVHCYYKKRGSDKQPEEEILKDIEPMQRHRLFEKRQQIRTILSRDASILFDSSIEVRHFMSQELISILASKPAAEVVDLMEREMIHHLLVCDKDNRLQGIISDRDFRARHGKTAKDLMTRTPTTVTANTPIGQAITILLNKRFSCLPVVDNGVPVGILTTSDLVMSFQCVLQVLVKIAREVHQSNGTTDDDHSSDPVDVQSDDMQSDDEWSAEPEPKQLEPVV